MDIKMIDSNQKEFKVGFGIDEKVEVTELEFKGSRGFINSIIIDSNGISYEVLLTEIVGQSKNIYKPILSTYLGSFLKSI
jgi:hypothetical protein